MTVTRRVGVIVAAVATTAACAQPYRAADDATSPATTADQPAPSITPNPSFPPIGGVVATGIRVDDRELLIWFGRFNARPDGVAVDHAWYDRATGAIGRQPETWPGPGEFRGLYEMCPPPATLHIHELWLVDGRMVDFGFVAGSADRMVMTQGGRTYHASLRPWAEDPSLVAFWLVRPAAPTTRSAPPPATDLPRIVATRHGAPVVDFAYTPCRPPAPRDG
ncbi:MAG TPA: hypothetical protein VF054_04115 [Micromonosporaceae bacterium]